MRLPAARHPSVERYRWLCAGWPWRSLVLLLAALLSPAVIAGPTCSGRFPNPITDICWSCMFPISIGGSQALAFDQEDTANPGGNPLCGCPPLRVGIKTGFWEPARPVEVTRTPYCFMTLNGLELNLGIAAPRHHRAHSNERASHSFYQVHWYMNPLLYWLEVLLDDACLETGTGTGSSRRTPAASTWRAFSWTARRCDPIPCAGTRIRADGSSRTWTWARTWGRRSLWRCKSARQHLCQQLVR